MTFKLSTSPSFEAKVTVSVAGLSGAFTARFKRLDQAQMDALHQRLMNSDIGDADIVDEILLGWGNDLLGEDGSPLAQTERATLLAVAGMRACIVRAFFEAYAPARRGN